MTEEHLDEIDQAETVPGFGSGPLKQYTVLRKLNHNNQHYEINSRLWLSEDHARPLLEVKAVSPLVAEAPVLAANAVAERIARKRAEMGA